MSETERHHAARTYVHGRQFSQTIGACPSTGRGEREAAAYAAHVLRHAVITVTPTRTSEGQA
jgi:hypothetical protein